MSVQDPTPTAGMQHDQELPPGIPTASVLDGLLEGVR